MSVIENENFQAKPDHQETPDAPPRASLGGGACTARTPDPTISDGHQILTRPQAQHQDHFLKLGLSQIPAGN